MFCQGGSVVLTASQGSSHLWSNNASAQSITVTSSGSYSVVVTNTTGCSAGSDVITVTVNAAPVVNLGRDTATCGCITLNAYNPGASYLWSNGQDYSMIKVCKSGTYWVSVSNGICITTDTIKVVVNPTPVVNISVISGATVTLNAGNAGANYLWNTGASTQTISTTIAGQYFVTVTNQYGCSASDTTFITVDSTVQSIHSVIPLTVYPVPSYDKIITVGFEVKDTTAVEIRIVDALGQIVYRERIENFTGVYDKKIGLQTLHEGIYFIEMLYGRKRSVAKIALE
jgi:hypothetical protein